MLKFLPRFDSTRLSTPEVLRSKEVARQATPRRASKGQPRRDTPSATEEIL
jgi:hypothetical protein